MTNYKHICTIKESQTKPSSTDTDRRRAQNDRNSVSNLRKISRPFDDSQPSKHLSSAIAFQNIICSIDIEQQFVQSGQHRMVDGLGPFGFTVKMRK
jgi:hypothetical protein